MDLTSVPRGNPFWLFGLLAIPWGATSTGVVGLLIPYLLRKHNVPVDHIAEVVAVAGIPLMWSFVAAPVVDLGLPRRIWAMFSAAASGLAAATAIILSTGSLPLLTFLLFTTQLAITLLNSANGGLMSAVRPEVRGRVAGFYQAGNQGAGALAGGGLIWLADRVTLPWLAVLTALVIIGPGLAALWIDETPHPTLTIGAQFSALLHDLRDVLSSRRTWVGLMFFLSPAGVGAVTGLISGVGPDYHATGTEVAIVTGTGGGLLLAMGAFAAGLICDRTDRKTSYAVMGLFVALGAVWLAIGRATPFTFAAGYSAYAFATGMANGAYVALILETLDKRKRGASTGYALMSSSGNAPPIYMTWLDGIGYRKGGARGLMATDAVLGGLGGLILFVVARRLVKRGSAPGAKPATGSLEYGLQERF